MNELAAQPVRGTEVDPLEPLFSPDGQWLAYFAPTGGIGANANFALRKVAVAGGSPVTVAEVPGMPTGAVWRNGMIAWGGNSGRGSGILAVPESGGAVRTLVAADPSKEHLTFPQLLPDGKHLLFLSSVPESTEGQIVVQTADGKDRKTLVSGATDPRVLPTGQLVYAHEGTLLAVPFGAGSLTVTGLPVSLVDDVTQSSVTLAAQYAISSGGTLAFRPGTYTSGERALLVWVDREGHAEPIPAPVRA
ncbi:MAG: TolB family protein [Bryobacteraceae bacterium]